MAIQIAIGCVLVVAVVLLLVAALGPPGSRLRDIRGTIYMLLIGVPAIVIQTDLVEMAALSGGSVVLFEMLLLMIAL